MKPDLTELLTLIQTKKLVPIIDRQLPLEDVNEAFRIVEDREVFGKILVRP